MSDFRHTATVRSYARHAAAGFAIAAALVAALFWLDSGQLAHIVSAAGGAWAAAAVMWLGLGVLFALVQCMMARHGGDDDDDSGPRGGGGPREPHDGRMIPIRAEARSRDTHR
ncbi:hypothetical protein [Roseovarius aquimarinus]|uniref:Uncharacterized protein n=1 Tax=Roseovarius aquimarinus TaxID=1229156 RepID=A0ABW7I5D9_9RHOB